MTTSNEQSFSVISDGLPSQLPDVDPDETTEWLDSLDAVIDGAGRGRARYLMLRMLERARQKNVRVPATRTAIATSASSARRRAAPLTSGPAALTSLNAFVWLAADRTND